jgi:hypothetical protein
VFQRDPQRIAGRADSLVSALATPRFQFAAKLWKPEVE